MRKGFTLLELIFVIVIMGIMAKFGVELLYKTYENYIQSNTFNRLENESEMAVKQIANRLQYRIKDSTIARIGPAGDPVPIGSISGNETVLEWIGIDIDGWRSSGAPLWSGFVDLRASTAGQLFSPGGGAAGNGALFFIGSDVDLTSNFGWGTGSIGDQSASMHPVSITAGTVGGQNGSIITPDGGDFSDATGGVYEFYQFSKTAYAISLEGSTLMLYSGYQPWDGGTMANGRVLMENVKSFQFASVGDTIIVQVCLTDNNAAGLGEYSLCKEKVVF
jgi:prepilin-type N-terminal cleavage/methylation domain-containing protein